MAHEGTYVPRTAQLVQSIEENSLERTFTFELLDGQPLRYNPGQFMLVTVFGAGEAPFTLCSMPGSDGRLRMTVRRYPGGRVTEALHEMEPGAHVGIRGPFGSGFGWGVLRGRDVLVVAGGIGMAPQRGLIEAILNDREQFGKLTGFYGMANPEQMLYDDLMQEWLERPEIDLFMTIDRPHPDWSGHVGLITTLFEDFEVDALMTSATVVGPPVMYRFVIKELEALALNPEYIFLSLERRMSCGVGKCGHCAIKGTYVCIAGPVFSLTRYRQLDEE